MLRRALLLSSLPLGAIVLFAGMASDNWGQVLAMLVLAGVMFGVCGIVVQLFRRGASRRQRWLEKLASPDFTMLLGPPPKIMLFGAFILTPMALAQWALAVGLFGLGNGGGVMFGSLMALGGLAFQVGVQRRVSDYLLWRNAWKEARAQRHSGLVARRAVNLGRSKRGSVL